MVNDTAEAVTIEMSVFALTLACERYPLTSATGQCEAYKAAVLSYH